MLTNDVVSFDVVSFEQLGPVYLELFYGIFKESKEMKNGSHLMKQNSSDHGLEIVDACQISALLIY